jgi:hypothetical protein
MIRSIWFSMALLLALLLCVPAFAQTINYGTPCATQAASCQFATGNTVPGNATGKGRLYEFQVNNWSTTQSVTVIVVDSLTVPGAGTVTPIKWYGVSAAPSAATPAGVGVSWIPDSLYFNNGITILCSTTGPTTYTPAASCTFSGGAQ